MNGPFHDRKHPRPHDHFFFADRYFELDYCVLAFGTR